MGVKPVYKHDQEIAVLGLEIENPSLKITLMYAVYEARWIMHSINKIISRLDSSGNHAE